MPTFSRSLVLNQFLLSHFGVKGFEPLSKELKSSAFEGVDENNISKFYHELRRRMLNSGKLSETQLLEYDQNIISHTQRINEKRTEPISWKYFQYLSLLFTEIYLDKFFQSREGLLAELNKFLDRWNDINDDSVPNPDGVIFEPFQYQDINKLAYWNATGSGKTLLMHVNILQYEYWRKHHKDDNSNKILLITPNEGLSKQHLEELQISNIPGNIFSKRSSGVFSGTEVEILEITKLQEQEGPTTVSFEAFETNNLVLIDEGHKGFSKDAKAFKPRRDYLSEDGFAFEYSATFGQAVAKETGRHQRELIEEYGKAIIFDYSYKHFYRDGFGKDYHILNLPDDKNETFVQKYLTGALLSYYQQKLVFQENRSVVNEFMLSNPLWIFVGGSVTQSLSKTDEADIPRILKFFQWFIKEGNEAAHYLELLLKGNDGIVDQQNRSIFNTFFEYVRERGFTPKELYIDILETVFNTTLSGSNLYVDNLNGIDGELGIRIGDSDYFGVINIGEDRKLYNKCQEAGIPGLDKDFSESLFHGITEDGSSINVLIGAKKFTEGWSSWRVSTMGLMNVGRKAGPQIIQLFGRGVRLKGYNWTLKRSEKLDEYERPPSKIPSVIQYLERLNVFGIRSDYMQNFKEILKKEDLPTNDSFFQKIKIPILPQVKLDNRRLKILTIEEGVNFKKDVRLELKFLGTNDIRPLKLDWYPKVQILRKAKGSQQSQVNQSNRATVRSEHTAFIDWDQVFFELQKFKNERSWYNLSIPKEVLPEIIHNGWWYELYIPADETKMDAFDKVYLWSDVVTSLLKGYIERFYNRYKSDYLSKHMKTEWLTPDHPNFEQEYEVMIEESEKRIIENVTKLAGVMRSNTFNEKDHSKLGNEFEAFNFLRHLYKPLLYINKSTYKDIVKITPVALENSEWQFVRHLKEYYLENEEKFQNAQLCLLRNQSRKGIGFFDAHGFYPDFILWLIDKDLQHISFIDPKGLRQVTGFNHPKIQFYNTIKEEIEPRIDDNEVNLSSFIVTPTTYREVQHWEGGHSIEDFNKSHVYFMQEQRNSYIEAILEKMVNG